MGRSAATGAAALGGAAILVGGMTTSWWQGQLAMVDAEIGLRSMKVCLSGACESDSLARVLAGHDGFRLVATATWIVCLVVGVLLIGGAGWLYWQGNTKGLAIARWGSVVGFVCAVLTVALFPGTDVSVGWSFWTTVGGALAGFVGGTAAVATQAGAWEGAGYVPVSMPSAPRITPRTPPMGSGEIIRPERSGPVARGSTTGRVSAADAAAQLRFVVKQLTIGEGGLEAEMQDGSARSLGWTELGSLFVGQLPVDPPFEKRVFLDLVPRVGGAPLRLLGTTRANYDATGTGGAAATSVENFRRLAAHARAKAPGLAVDHVTRAFVQDRKAPRQFLVLSQFTEYDSRYGA